VTEITIQSTKPLLMPVLMVGRNRPTQRALASGGVGDCGFARQQ
jgi:hypothetical protein